MSKRDSGRTPDTPSTMCSSPCSHSGVGWMIKRGWDCPASVTGSAKHPTVSNFYSGCLFFPRECFPRARSTRASSSSSGSWLGR